MEVKAKHTPAWAYDPQTREHFLPINDVEAWKVYKTAVGDYALTLHNDDDGHGGDVEYFDTLIAAKSTASSRYNAIALHLTQV